jgi:single-stranded-DNA-specific exonuclease
VDESHDETEDTVVEPPAETLPDALAVLNPNRGDCSYPCKFLCGAAVAFKLAHSLMLELLGETRTTTLLPSFLKIVAIATIADAVPLLDENRVFAKLGLRELRRPVSAGLKALMEVAAVDLSRPVRASDIGFRVAPRMNAAGRMDEAGAVIELLTTRDAERATAIATRLDQLNAARQQEERRILQQIHQTLAEDASLRESWCIVVAGEGWHRGVIGITASRVVEKYFRPAIVLSCENGEAHGSGRSIPAYHLLSGLESCAEIFLRFGGHAHAVGMALPVERIAELRAALDAHARARLTEADFIPELAVDAELPLTEITPELFATLSQVEPFGHNNPEPVFVARNVPLLEPVRVLKEAHIKLKLGVNGRRSIPAVGWRMAERVTPMNLLAGDRVDVAFTLEENLHPDFGGIELRLLDLRRAEGE